MIIQKVLNGLYFALLFLSFSCQTSENRRRNDEKMIQWIGKKIQFPKELMILNGEELIPFDVKKMQPTHKVISIIDATCAACILGQLNRIDSSFQTIVKETDRVIFILNVNRKDSALFMVSLRPLINAKGYVLWDSNYYFEKANDIFSEDFSQRTFLINSDYEVVLVGNPLFRPELFQEYIERLTRGCNVGS